MIKTSLSIVVCLFLTVPSLAQPLKATLKGHTHKITSLTFNQDGTTLASIGLENTIKFWDTKTWKLKATPLDLPVPWRSSFILQSLTFGPDGKPVAVTSGSRNVAGKRSVPEIKLWDVTTKKVRVTLKGHQQFVRESVFSPDGKTLATASQVLVGSSEIPEELKLWNVETGKLTPLKGRVARVNQIAFSADGKTLADAMCWPQDKIRLWEVATGNLRATIRTKNQRLSGMCLSPDGRVLAGVGRVLFPKAESKEKITLWDISTGQIIGVLEGSQVGHHLCFRPDGRMLASATYRKQFKQQSKFAPAHITLWDIKTQKPRVILKGRGKGITCLAFSPDGKTLVAASHRTEPGSKKLIGDIQVWDVSKVK